MIKRQNLVMKYVLLISCFSTIIFYPVLCGAKKFLDGGPCSMSYKIDVPCLCYVDDIGRISVNCNGVAFTNEFPIFPHRAKIYLFSQSDAGLQSLEAQLFTASDIPLQILDFSHNSLRRLTERMLDGVEDTLIELNLRKNKLGDQLNYLFSTQEFHYLKNLKKLDLSKNEIRDFQPGIFNGLINLQELKLQENILTTVPRSALHHLHSLEFLYLQSNYIFDINLSSFPNITNLQMLNLSSNDIISIKDRAFSPLPRLKTLILSNNQIQVLNSGFLDGLLHIEYLDLSQNLLEEILINQSSGRSIKKLFLSANKIRNLNKISLNSFQSLELLDLQRNQIFEIGLNIFSSLVSLKQLYLDINAVRKMSDKFFFGLESLADLTLNDNKILAFPTESLNIFTNLRKISLDYNRIAAISAKILAPVRKNKELSLAFNLISEIPSDTFRHFTYLELLNLHGNKIVDFSGIKTKGLDQTLVYLDIGFNEISELPQFNFSNLSILSVAKNKISKIREGTFRLLSKLIYLDLSYNMISEFPLDLFIGFKQLERLDFQQNFLFHIPVNIFKNLSIINISFKNNHLKTIVKNTFDSLDKLKQLDISFNKIEIIADDAFNNIKNLEFLSLMGNHISEFSGSEFSTETNIKTLILSHNKITYLNSKSFLPHSKISYLDLSYNELTHFLYTTISHLQHLEEISLAGNKLKAIGENCFSNLPYLKEIILKDNLIFDINELAFRNSSSLRKLVLHNNKVSSLAENVFIGLNRLNLDISYNNISELPVNIFSHINGLKLEIIDLAGNNFEDFPNEVLKKQYSFLEKVNISYNKIKNLPSNADVLVNVKELDLSFNPLSLEAFNILFTEPKSIRKLFVKGVNLSHLSVIESPFLHYLNLEGNKLLEIKSNVFYKTNMISHLVLADNFFPNLNFNLLPALTKLSYLQVLDVSGNPVQYITGQDFYNFSHLRSLEIKNLKKLTDINCESIQNLPRIRKLKMQNFESLRLLNLQKCLHNISGLELLAIEIKESSLKDQLQAVYSPKLQILEIIGKELTTIASSAFAGMLSSTVKIKISGTSIITFSDKIFFPLPLSSKIEFNVPFNKIHYLNHDLLGVLDNKQVNIYIYGLNLNPIKCDCHIDIFWTWVQEKNISVNQNSSIEEIRDLTCFQPQSLKGQKVRDLQLKDLICNRFNFSTIATPFQTSYFAPTSESNKNYNHNHNHNHPYSMFEMGVTKKPSVPLSYIPASSSHNTLTKVDTMIIGIVTGVVAFVCILIVIICVIRLRRAHPLYTAGPLAGPLAFRTGGKCTCLKPPSRECTCYPMYSIPYSNAAPPSLLPGHLDKMSPPTYLISTGFQNSAVNSGRLKNIGQVVYPDNDNNK